MKFKKFNKKTYPEALFELSQQQIFFLSTHNWKAVNICLFRIAQLQYSFEKNEEALEALTQSTYYAKQMKQSLYNHKHLKVKILVALHYSEGKVTWKAAYRILKKIECINDEDLLWAALVLVKNSMIGEAEAMLGRSSSAGAEELQLFVEAVIAGEHGMIKTSAEKLFETISLKKYYNPIVRRMCICELQNIFPEENIEKMLFVKEFYNEIVVVNEYSEFLDENIIEACKIGTNKLINRLNPGDMLSYCWFNREMHVLCELIDAKAYKKTIKSCITISYDTHTKVKLFDAIAEGILRFSVENHRKIDTRLSFEIQVDKVANRFMLIVCSGKDSSTTHTISTINRLIKETNAKFVVLGMNCSDKSKITLKKLVSGTRSAKCYFCTSPTDLNSYFLKIRNMF